MEVDDYTENKEASEDTKPNLQQVNSDPVDVRNLIKSEITGLVDAEVEKDSVKRELNDSGILDEVSGKIILETDQNITKCEEEYLAKTNVLSEGDQGAIKTEVKDTLDKVPGEYDGEKLGLTISKDYLPPHSKVYGDTMKGYSDQFKEFTTRKLAEGIPGIKSAKDYLYDMKKNLEENEKYLKLSEKQFKCEEEDPLLRAMKNELSTRIFGSKSNSSIKKEDSDDPYLFRNTSSPLSNGDRYSSLNALQNNFSLFREAEMENEQWFSILPKESCDSNTLLLGKNESEKISLPLYLPPRGGLPPSPGPLPPCDSPAPLVLSQEEAAMLEELKTHGPRPPSTPKPVPRELRRGWWRINDPDQLHAILESLHSRGVRERELKRMLSRYLDDTLESGGKSTSLKANSEMTDLEITEADTDISKLPGGAPLRDLPGYWDRAVAQRVDNLILDQVENLEDKVANASMQVKGWKVPSRSSSLDSDSCEPNSKNSRPDPVELAKHRLIELEAAIERRYLKPPLGFASGEGGVGIQVDPDESIPKGLGIWRDAVAKSHTAAQLAMALYMLESCIAWDKSIMKANCQFCQSGDNEDKLLLCDGCDRGYHMYCFKPKMETIPEGDWYCYECKNKSSGERNCIVCGKRPVKNFVLCDHCPRAYHSDCLNPPLNKIPRGKWNCVTCAIKYPKKKCGRKVGWRKLKDGKTKDSDGHKDTSKDSVSGSGNDEKSDTMDTKNDDKSDSETDNEDLPLSISISSKENSKECVPLSPIANTVPCSSSTPNDEPPPLSPQQPTTTVITKKDKISKKLCKELNACKILVEEMELQDEAWPFLLPVNTKQFPTYKKIIKSPMDISTIKKRLTEGQYKSKEDFVSDVRQIFNNCETFNEDDSPVGKAGHAMRSFFETRWGELTNQKSTP